MSENSERGRLSRSPLIGRRYRPMENTAAFAIYRRVVNRMRRVGEDADMCAADRFSLSIPMPIGSQRSHERNDDEC